MSRYQTKDEREAAEPPLPRDRLWTDREAAAYLGVHPLTLVVWRGKGRGPQYFRPDEANSRIVRYDPADCIAYVKQNKRTPTAARPEGLRDVGSH